MNFLGSPRFLKPAGASNEVWPQVVSDIVGQILREEDTGHASLAHEVFGRGALNSALKERLQRLARDPEILGDILKLNRALFFPEVS